MSKKTKSTSTTNQTSNLVQTPTNPAWVDSGLANIGDRIGKLSDLDPYSFVAGPDALQTQAGQGAAGLTSSPAFGQASNAYNGILNGQGVEGASIAGEIPGFLNPYLHDVVDTSLANFDEGAGSQRAQARLDLGQDTTFGGSGGALELAKLGSGLALGRGTLAAGLRSDAYDKASGLASQQAQLRQQASLANLQARLQAASGLTATGQAQGEDARANIGAQASIGDMLQQLAQRRAVAPLSLLGTQAALFGGLPLGLLHGENQSGVQNSTTNSRSTVSDPLGSIGGVLAGAGSLASGLGALGLGFGAAGGAGAGLGAIVSDRRLKCDVVKVGEWGGLGLYAYRYLWSPLRHVGVMAQEVLRVKPEAVVTMPSGYLAVDYGKL